MDGSVCVPSTGPSLTLAAGGIYTFTIIGLSSYPVVFSTSSTTIAAYSGASPNPISGTSSGTITLTIPSTESQTTMYDALTPPATGSVCFSSRRLIVP